MSIFSFLRRRDGPTNRAVGGSYQFFMGGTAAGKTVTERSAMQFQHEGIEPFAAMENMSTRERNRNRIEIDANAFATYFQFLLYGIDKINDVPNHVKIDERLAEIIRNETWPGRVEKYFSTLPRRMLLSGKKQ